MLKRNGVAMPMRPLPTGEEPPKGFESIVDTARVDDALRIDMVVLSHLARVEMSEIELLRSKSLSAISSLVGLANEKTPFEREMNIIPDISPSDKMLFRAYFEKQLVGYALVIIGWPRDAEWVIQHMIIDPDYRLKGIGSSIVAHIEAFARSSEVDATSIFAIPIQRSGTAFWNDMGYVNETGRTQISIAGLDHDLIVLRKELPRQGCEG
jgi:GNAT superfamily N-acetyltransferase